MNIRFWSETLSFQFALDDLKDVEAKIMETNGNWVTGFCWKPQQRQFNSVPLLYWKKNDSEVWLESIKVLFDSAA